MFLYHINKFSKTICDHPGFNISHDEVIKLFEGQSYMTVRMKKKPVKEAFKFLAISDTVTDFIFYFVPDDLRE